jgi:hypothetical protein
MGSTLRLVTALGSIYSIENSKPSATELGSFRWSYFSRQSETAFFGSQEFCTAQTDAHCLDPDNQPHGYGVWRACRRCTLKV